MMNKIKKIKLNKKLVLPGVFLVVFFSQFVNIKTANANIITDWLWENGASTVVNIISAPIFTVGGVAAIGVGWIVGQVSGIFTYLLFVVAKYSGFIDESLVIEGWKLMRDLCNMFFVLILLIIAFATILRIENYSFKKLLPKLIIMAILINFSRTICGLIIDFSQVIMLTFINVLDVPGSITGHGALVNALGLQDIFSIQQVAQQISAISPATSPSPMSIFGSTMFGLILLLIACIVIVIFTIILFIRIIMLWILIILSPIAYIAAALPAAQKYASQWWDSFIKHVVVGPAMAFFLWLALSMSNQNNAIRGFEYADQNHVFISGFLNGIVGGTDGISSMIQYLVVILILIAGMIMAQQAGGAAGNMAGKGMGWARKAPVMPFKTGSKLSSWGARKFANTKHGFEMRPTKIIGGIKAGLEDKKRREDDAIQIKAASQLRQGKIRGTLGASQDFTESAASGFMYRRGWLGRKEDGKWKWGGTVQQTRKFGKAQKDIEDKEKDLAEARNNGDKDEENKIVDEIKALQQIQKDNKTPYTFHADQVRNKAISEQRAKLGDNDNEEDLIARFNDAVSRKDSEMASAVILQASKVGHLNEIIQSQKSKKDFKYEFAVDGDSVREGEYLPQGGMGLNELINQKLIGELGMNEQEAYSIQSQASTAAKSVGHYNLSESVGVENGLLKQRDHKDQQQRARGELRKVDVEKTLRQFTRLAHGDEIQIDITNEKGEVVGQERQFKLNNLGKANYLENAGLIKKEIERGRLNKNYAMNMVDDEKAFREWIGKLKDSEQDHFEYMDKKGEMIKGKYSDVADDLMRYGKTVKVAEKKLEKSVNFDNPTSSKPKKEEKEEIGDLKMENTDLNK